jgi:hypothetical protein
LNMDSLTLYLTTKLHENIKSLAAQIVT